MSSTSAVSLDNPRGRHGLLLLAVTPCEADGVLALKLLLDAGPLPTFDAVCNLIREFRLALVAPVRALALGA